VQKENAAENTRSAPRKIGKKEQKMQKKKARGAHMFTQSYRETARETA